MVDNRAAPQESSSSGGQGAGLSLAPDMYTASGDNSVIEELAAAGIRFSSVSRGNSDLNVDGSYHSTVTPQRTARTPAEGYNVNAASKGRGEEAVTRDGSAPGAVAVSQRAAGYRTRRPLAASNNSIAVSGIVGSGRQMRGSSNALSGSIQSRPSTQRAAVPPVAATNGQDTSARSMMEQPAEPDQSHIPPEMRVVRNIFNDGSYNPGIIVIQ